MRAMVYEAYTMSGTSQGWAVNMIRLQWRRTKTRERRVPVSSYPIPSCLCPCYVSCPITHVSVLCILCYHTCLCCVSCPTTRVSVLCILSHHMCVCAMYPVLSHVCLCCVSYAITCVSVLCVLSHHTCVCAVYPVLSHVCLCCVSCPITPLHILCMCGFTWKKSKSVWNREATSSCCNQTPEDQGCSWLRCPELGAQRPPA